MESLPQKKFTSPEEEIAYLREQINARDAHVTRNKNESASETVPDSAREVLRSYAEADPDTVLDPSQQFSGEKLNTLTEKVSATPAQIDEVMHVVREHGIKNAFTVLEKLNVPHVTDEVHRLLIEEIKDGQVPHGLKEGMPAWQVLHMSLFEVALPEYKQDGKELELKALLSAMEQFYAGMQAVGYSGTPTHYALEIAVAEGSDQIIFYVAIPTNAIDLFEKQILSLFPQAVIVLAEHDYNIFTPNGVALASTGSLKKHPIYPIKTYEDFSVDPMHVLLNAFSKIEREGGGAAVQLVIQAGGKIYHNTYEDIIKRVREGEKPNVAIRKSTLKGELFEHVKDMFSSAKKDESSMPNVDQELIDLFVQKIDRTIVPTNIRIAVSARDQNKATQMIGDIEAGFHQYERTKGNGFTFTRVKGMKARSILKAFSFREFHKQAEMPLSLSELATLLHVPAAGIDATPQFKQSHMKSAPAPLELPQQGTLLGVNAYRNVETNVYVTPEDRLRHFYIIGQTGTGKTTLMKNMLMQDIEEGAGACMIDPHGTDIFDVLGAIPDYRKEDVIYFDPSRMDHVLGLNMLEYDYNYPEQKTFVVNELFSIFQKLYGGIPESMGPMFEQYFRNATLLVLEDPESGSTLLDISRVLADEKFRRMKLERAVNPVVVQFWNEIATKAGGEAALENIVPYITSKFDVFTANDYMRPIIGQQHSAFNFREIMDGKKILLVNLSKGRLGEINANLIGMIIVGKILMAALSRVDDPTKSFPPFYLHMDEFQNVTTNSITSILSEARKYKLGLTIAHQFIAQLDENIRDAVFGNVGSIAAFRVGNDDAQILEQQFKPVFNASDLMNIENRNAYVRILANGTPTKPFNIRTLAPQDADLSKAEALILQSYERYGQPRRKVEMDIMTRYQQ